MTRTFNPIGTAAQPEAMTESTECRLKRLAQKLSITDDARYQAIIALPIADFHATADALEEACEVARAYLALLAQPEPTNTRAVAEKLDEIADALDMALGDTDITHIGDDEELRERYPVQWACMQVNLLLQATALPAPNAQAVAGTPSVEFRMLYTDYEQLQRLYGKAILRLQELGEKSISLAATLPDAGRNKHE